MAYRNSFAALLSLLALSLAPAACGFGDDQGGRPIEPEVDAPPADAPPIDAPPVDAPPMAKVFQVMPNPPTPIPDNDAMGVDIPFTVTGVSTTTGLDVQVDIDHTYSGDVVISLFRNTAPVKRLRFLQGGATPDIQETYNLTPAELGTPLNGSYVVRVSDLSILATGTVNLVKLTFKVN